jgi:uncharacterized protein YheU (UPF0270 family)
MYLGILLTALEKTGSIAPRLSSAELAQTLNDEPQFPSASEEPVAIPHTELSADALRGVVESFVLREGTDYGEKDFSLEQKVAHVIGQLARGDARIMFDPNSESIHIVSVAPLARGR